ncbi:MAG: ribonuclease III [Deltaproteobacteria bacterium]|jgi:UDP-N-acetylmuramate: L-alanyl-gamma-D-glutamyl-meso-diaminopimelate ligase|nr:ribonuclease III [Deltaproteobacteria bacterium]
MALDPNFNRLPENFNLGAGPHVHLLGIGGVAMACLAGLLVQAGCKVTGSDMEIYPPVSLLISSLNLRPSKGYGPESLEGVPDLVVVGNVVTRSFPVLEVVERRNLHYLSLPQTLNQLFLQKTKNVVVAGCHGKTSITNMTSLLFDGGSMGNGFLIGGTSLDFERPYRAASGEWFVLEGDEYDSAFFNKVPKFIHYRPYQVILTSVEYDHADIYPAPKDVEKAYLSLMALMPPEGLAIACGDDKKVAQVAKKAKCRKLFYGLGPKNDYQLKDVVYKGLNTSFTLAGPNGLELRSTLPKPGLYNALNAAAAVASFLEAGGDPRTVSDSLASLKGVKRRQEVVFDKSGLILIDDFAHHPTAVDNTLKAVKGAFPNRRLICAFEPRSNTTRRAIFQTAYSKSFTDADVVYLACVDNPEKAPEGDRLDVEKLARDIGPQATASKDIKSLKTDLVKKILPGDVVVTMSNGDFGGLTSALISQFAKKIKSGQWWKPFSTNLPSLNYTFKDKSLFVQALTHPSVRGKFPQQSPEANNSHNQRLEFLGDAVLSLCIADLLFSMGSTLTEGQMSKMRAKLVCEASLAELAKDLQLGEHIIMAHNEELNGGRQKPSLLADCFEALLGAVYLDGGLVGVKALVERIFSPHLDGLFVGDGVATLPKSSYDYKTKLQELTQCRKLGKPFYSFVSEEGPDHSATFTMAVELNVPQKGFFRYTAPGSTKRGAEQMAAKLLLEKLQTVLNVE